MQEVPGQPLVSPDLSLHHLSIGRQLTHRALDLTRHDPRLIDVCPVLFDCLLVGTVSRICCRLFKLGLVCASERGELHESGMGV